jgi:predicted nucleic acid-binding protein
MIIDTDVLIWFMRGNEKAKRTIDNMESFSISSVVYIEILQGIRNKNELKELKLFVRKRDILIIPLDPDITSRAIFFMERYSLSHGLRMADALIASTTDILGETLFTSNTLHYRMIPNLSLKKFRPYC